MSETTKSVKPNAPLRSLKSAKKNEFADFEMGKVPPQARDLEEAVLGAVMLEKEALDVVVEILKPAAFYVEKHKLIFLSILQLFKDNQPVDILTVTEQLKVDNQLEAVGGPFFIASLTNRVASTANVEYHARIIAQKYIQRQLIVESSKIIQESYEDTMDVFQLLDKAEQRIFSIADDFIRKDTASVSNVLIQAVKEIKARSESQEDGDKLTGVPAGFTQLDRMTSGWQKSDMIIVAARPGMGKTAFTLALARNAAIDSNKPIAMFSLEMSSLQLVNRLISMETELPQDKLRKGDLKEYEWQQLTTRVEKLREAPIFIDDTPALSVFDLRAKCRRLKSRYDIQMIIIDYLQLMRAENPNGKASGNREQEISTISRSLKVIAKELEVPVIALSQLSRAVEQRGGTKRPILSDLRESGAIEQDADLVVFLYRPEYYGIYQDEDGVDCTGIAEVIIAKHRNGALGTVKTRFVDRFAKFVDLESQEGFDFNPNDQKIFTTIGSRMNEGGDQQGGATPPPPADDSIPF